MSVLHHPGQPQMQAEVILASTTALSPPIYTIRLRYPRIIHGEVMTHRVFGRNARSSRAVPVRRMLEEVRETPFIPWHRGKQQSGMQAGAQHDEPIYLPEGLFVDNDRGYSFEAAWLYARDQAAMVAEGMFEANYHKQTPNRLLEPFSWIDVLITATDWGNFLWLRDHEDAEPHLQDLARLVRVLVDEALLQELEPGMWHTPYVTNADRKSIVNYSRSREEAMETILKVSAARCARISYKPFDSDGADIEKDLQLYDKLVAADRKHASPLEHQATPDGMLDIYSAEGDLVGENYEHPRLHGNLTGWIQYRKTIPGESYRHSLMSS